MAQTHEYSKMKHVYYSVGKFKDDQAPRFIKAPFDLVIINGITYIQPVPFNFSSAAVANASATDAEQARLSRQSYYTDLEPVIVEEHEMGCNSPSMDNWKAVHRFSTV